MNLAEIKQHIQSKKLSPVYIFTGEEIGVMDIYINQMAKVKNCEISRADSFKDIFNNLKVAPIVGKSNICFCRDDAEVLNNEKIWKLIEQTQWIKQNVIILAFTNLDKRKSFYKRFKAHICEFEHLDDKILIKYIRKQINLSDASSRALIEACESDYSRIMLEIDKIKQYESFYFSHMSHEPMTPDVCFKELLKRGIIYSPAKDSIFAWSDALMYRKRATAFELMQECFESGEAVLTMLTVAYMNVKQLLQVKSCDSKDISKSTGLTGWQIQCAKKFINKYSIEELLNALKLIREMEVGIKTGKIEEQTAIPYLMINML